MVTVKQIEKYAPNPNILTDMEGLIDMSIKQFHGWYKHEMAILASEYPVHIRNIISQKYINEGNWKYVYHSTSSELGQKSGLTIFYFSQKPLCHAERYYCLSNYIVKECNVDNIDTNNLTETTIVEVI